MTSIAIPFRWSFPLLLTIAPLIASADTLSLKLENDILSRAGDGHYSNGLELGWAFTPESEHWTRSVADLVPGWSSLDVDTVAYRFTHQIFTPEDIETAALIEDDRPYAGVMFGGVSLYAATQHDGWRQTRGLGLDIGLVGPGTGAGRIQRAVHEATDSDAPDGWDHQLENEPFVNLSYTQRWWLQHRLAGIEFEYGPSLGAAAGNLYTYAATGLGLRIGQGLDRSVSIPSVAPTPSGNPVWAPTDAFGWFLFANLEGRYMAHNLLLDGNTWKDSHSVDSREWVGDAQVGVAFGWQGWQLAFSNVWRSREFSTQREHDQFGSLTLSTQL